MQSHKSNSKSRSLRSKKTNKTKKNIKSKTSSKKVNKHVMKGGSNLVAQIVAQVSKNSPQVQNTGTFQRKTVSHVTPQTGLKTLDYLRSKVLTKVLTKLPKKQNTYQPPKPRKVIKKPPKTT